MTSELNGRALLLSYITVGYNLVEGVVSIIAGALAGSVALVGFGLDSFVESLSGSVMIWRFRTADRLSEEEEERVEKQAVRLVALTFFILGVYVLYESLSKLYLREEPHPSLFGIVIAVVSLITMPLLYYLKVRTARSMGSKSLEADSRETLACAFLSLALLVGLTLNYLFGLWWADPAVGLLIVVYLFKEGTEAWQEGELCRC